jgi:hypothetical protein
MLVGAFDRAVPAKGFMSLIQNRAFYRSIVGAALMLLATLLLSGTVNAAQPKAGGQDGKPRQKTLDELLLEDLDPQPASKPPSEAAEPADPSREMIELGGEDVSLSGKSANENPLVRLHAQMQAVKRQIAEARGGQETQRLQHEISDDLLKLIAELEQASKQSKSASSSSGRQQASQPTAAMKPGDQASDKPARDSSAKTKEKQTAKADPGKLSEMLKDVWGHLPPHLRQQMEQSANEEFLPQYELEIAEYFRSLIGRKDRK